MMSDNDTDTDRQSEQDPFEDPSAEQDQQVQSETRAETENHTQPETHRKAGSETAESTLDMQPARRTAVGNQADGIAETFEKESIVNQIKSTIVLFFAVGVGAGINGFAITGSMSGDGGIMGGLVSSGILVATVVTLTLIGPVLAAFVGTRMGTALSEEPGIQTYTAAGISTFAGHILFFLIAFILTAAGMSGAPSVVNFLLPAIVSAIGTAIVGIVAVYGALTLIADS